MSAYPDMRSTLRVAPCPLGRGLFATRAYRPGDPIVVLRGPRYGRDDPVHLTPAGANLLQTGRRSYILPAPPGVFVNHSCDPNAGIVDDRRLIAVRDIAPGDEIRFDYSTTMDEDFWTMECRCGVPDCRGVVTDFRHLPSDVRQRYIALGVVPPFITRRWGRAG